MSGRPTEAFRREHADLMEHVEHLRLAAREVPRLSAPERRLLVDRVLGFLRGTLIPHAEAEEAVLYPEWAALVDHPDAALPMIHDHEAIVARIERLAATPAEDSDELQELLYGLHALIVVHFHKEEDIQLAAFDAQPQAVVDDLLRRMAEHAGPAHSHGG